MNNPLGLTVEITGSDEELAKIRRLGDSFSDFSDAMRTVGDELVKYFSGQAFASQGGVYGDQWPELNPVYAQQKAKDYPGRPILVKTGEMQQNFVANTNSTSAEITNTSPQFIYHQSTAPRSKIPRRAMMEVNDDVHNIIQQIFEDDVAKKIANA